ncbi:MAG TPA: Holliday junction branch migration protein RuvA [Arachidicoccus sp.]
MIAFLKGEFVGKTPASVIVNVQGVGYDVNISLNTYSAISELQSGLLYTHLHITENAQTLYGFADTREKLLFLQLISVSGVGASTARMMLSGMKPDEIVKAIVQGNTPQLEKIKGIGRKTAERLIVELKDKLAKIHDMNVAGTVLIASSIETDALDALMALGIGRAMAENAIKKTMRSAESTDNLETLIKLSLKNL